MTRLDVRPDHRLLLRVLRDPHHLQLLSPAQFSHVIDAARDSRLLGWLLTQVETHQLPVNPPEWLNDRLITVQALVRNNERALKWEIDRLNRAFSASGVPWVLLKGGAYVAAALPPGRGRSVADIDILAPYDLLEKAEEVLRAHGWEVGDLDAYDERYYREWMHELPPMVHKERRSIVDLHHAVLPRTSRLNPPSAHLIDRSVEAAPGVRVLCPAHMVLHAAAHLFHDGEIAGAIRDVVDLDGLLRCFGQAPSFWPDLIQEARVLGLTRPAYYALRYAQRILGTPLPAETAGNVAAWAPATPVRVLMDLLVERTVPGSSGWASSVAAFALYGRSHWLRMPPLLLARHLLRKGLRRH
jgi:hypothetical protein